MAGLVVHPRPPVLRVRYRHGLYIDLRGYPDWLPYASAMVRVAPVPPGLSVDEARLIDVLIANRLLARALSPSAALPVDGATPAGWVWAHVGNTRDVALVPADLHAAFRHRGGVSTMRLDVAARGLLTTDRGAAVRFQAVRTVAEDALVKFEDWLGTRLPAGYREHLRATNGGVPTSPGVWPGAGFLVDQPLFGLAAEDRAQDLAQVNTWLGDRLTTDFLAIGHVQGGLLAVKVRGDAAGSVWFWDDDDPRDDERYEAPVICGDLLVRCAEDFPAFVAALSTVPAELTRIADGAVRAGRAELLTPDGMGAALPRTRRPGWLRALAPAAGDEGAARS
jgi:hypothetical protein